MGTKARLAIRPFWVSMETRRAHCWTFLSRKCREKQRWPRCRPPLMRSTRMENKRCEYLCRSLGSAGAIPFAQDQRWTDQLRLDTARSGHRTLSGSRWSSCRSVRAQIRKKICLPILSTRHFCLALKFYTGSSLSNFLSAHSFGDRQK